MSAPYPLEHGHFIQVRQRPYMVIGIEQSALPPDTMRSDDALGEELRVIWEQEELSQTCNRFHDLGDATYETERLSAWLVAMDRAVAAPYG